MSKKPFVIILVIILFSLFFISCKTMQAYARLNSNSPEEIARGNPNNPVIAKEYLQNILLSPDDYTVKAYSRRAFSVDGPKNLFVSHSFYVYFKHDTYEHTLSFTATPKGSELNGCWMLDSETDVASYNSFIRSSNNPWDVEEYKKSKGHSKIDLLQTTEKIIERIDKGYPFWGPASVRDLPWYHLMWISLVPPPIISLAPILIFRHNDNCTSAILETTVWEQ
jgi:hypothetical protein